MAALDTKLDSAVEVAVELFRQHKADFADCVHIALAHFLPGLWL